MSAFEAPIRLRLGSSKWLAWGLALAYGGAMAVVLPLDLPGWVKALLEPIIVADWVRAFRWHVQHQGDAITGLIAQPQGEWIVTTAKRGDCRGRLALDSVVLPWLTVLVFRLEDGRRRSAVLLLDNVDEDSFRRLRVRLRHPGQKKQRSEIS